jgi:uncharacterized membrane-anchored protein YitT (DUF2179 family)
MFTVIHSIKIKKHEIINHVAAMLPDIILILSGVFIAGFGLKGFLVPNHFLDGGLTGISLLLHEIFHFPLGLLIILFNIPFIITGYFSISRLFAFKSLIAVLLLAAFLVWFPYPVITSDKLLIAVFGGFFLGVGIGLTMRAGCAVDGLELLAIYTLKRIGLSLTEIILAINIVLFSAAALILGLEISLYAALTYFTVTKTIDFVIQGIEAYIGITIVSSRSTSIRNKLVQDFDKAVTIYKGERGFLPNGTNQYTDCDIVFTVATRLEFRKLKNIILQEDPKAFVFANSISDAAGGVLKQRHAH